MSPRPKTAPDAVILEAAARLLSRLGPAKMRLEDVANEVALSPATLLQRFKSKRGLLLAVAEHSISGMAKYFRERRERNPSALDALADVSECIREIADEPQQLANLLAFLQLSLEDPEFRACAERHDVALEQEVARLLDEARSRGEMVDCCTRALSRAVIAMMRGSLLTWSALGHHTTPEAWVKADLDTLLGPYRQRDIRSTEAQTTPPARLRVAAKKAAATVAARKTTKRRVSRPTRATS